jgi:hypothetical protein
MGEPEMSEGQMIAEDYALRSVMQELQSTEIIIEAKVPFGCPSAVLGLEDDKDWVIDYSPLKVTPSRPAAVCVLLSGPWQCLCSPQPTAAMSCVRLFATWSITAASPTRRSCLQGAVPGLTVHALRVVG